MAKVFISYARADGATAAARLRDELTAMGVTVWRDIEEMRGGQAWKEQLRTALRQVDAVVVVLTPGAVGSKMVEWEWENAITLEKRVIPVLAQACQVPDELERLHYHDLSNPTSASYTRSFAKLARDINQLPTGNPSPPPETAATGSKYHVEKADRSAIGDNATVTNTSGGTKEN